VDRQEVRRVYRAALLASALSWLPLLIRPELIAAHVHDWRRALTVNSNGTLVLGWFLMLAAMMAPVLIPPICYVRSRSFARRRGRSVALFVCGYAAVWTVAAPLLLIIEAAARTLSPRPYLTVAALILVALAWQCSPIKQICLNRCHANGDIAAFGIEADLSAVRFGFEHGFWCAGSCWALMLLPPLVPQAHLLAMAVVTMLVFSDRLARPRLPNWRRLIRAAHLMSCMPARDWVDDCCDLLYEYYPEKFEYQGDAANRALISLARR